ncbi:MAG: LysR family transcriptional regulator [Peptococcaceae bacterium]|nr:LysR family transcriptional regulator [Peptococcaceae bacterium]
MKYQQLTLLCALEQYGSLSQTAEHLFVSQPSLSHALKKLEEELGCILVLRHHNGVSFTAEGKLALATAHEMLGEIVQIRAIAEAAQKYPEQIKIASNTLAGMDVLKRALFADDGLADQTSVHLQELGDAALLHQLQYGNVDAAILQINALDPEKERARLARKSGLQLTPLGTHALVILVRRAHPLCHKQAPLVADFFAYPFVTAHVETNRLLAEALAHRGYTQSPLEIQDTACLNALLQNSDCWSLVSASEKSRHALQADGLTFLEASDFAPRCAFYWLAAAGQQDATSAALLTKLRSQLEKGGEA